MQNRIRQLMESQHMNQQNFAQLTGIKAATLSGIFTGRTNPTVSIISAIRKTFPNVNIDWLMWGEGNMYATDSGAVNSSMSSVPSSSTGGVTETSQSLDPVPSSADHQYEGGEPNGNSHGAVMSQMASGNVNHPTANMAQQSNVAPDLFSSIPASQTQVRQNVSPNQSRGQQRSQHVAQVNVTTQPKTMVPQDYIVQQSATLRKITEIRVFYDDQTWESFVPKK